MQIRLAETAGFCFGVERAVALAEQTARSCKNAVTLGPIIHNRHVVARFELLGLREISAADEAQPGQTVVIRAHGIPVGEQRMLSARGALTVDATCPFVKKIHVIAQKAERDGRSLLIIGTPTHPEIIAIASYSSDAHVFQSAEALETWLTERPERRDLPFCLVSQTTGTQKLWESCREIAKKCVQIAKYLIQYAELRKCGRKKQLFFQRVVMRWSLSGMQEAPIRGGLP